MRVLQSWLKEYLKFSIPPEELVERLTMLGLEFESVDRLGEKFRGFVVGHVLDCARHPNADRLSVCSVHVGKETLQIVCGAPNVAAGQKVAVGLIGAVVPRRMHDPAGTPLVLSPIAIRGVDSRGMICSEAELDLGPESGGIMVLEPKARAGQPLAVYLGLDDVAYDVEVTPNRPDWLSHMGVAREIAVLTGRKPALPRVRLREGKTPVTSFLKVRVADRVNCPRFAARVIRGVTIAPSPAWLQTRLRNAGFRPRNNVVDITNYVMLECGQPMHAFDHAMLRGGTIIIRQATEGTRFTTLDGREHSLPAGTVMVCDAEREVSVAGVMGGANSEISEGTVDIVLESAYWKPASIRKTAKALGIVSDASQRFERGADPQGVRYALDRAAGLVLELAGGTLLRGVIDVYPKKIHERVIRMRPSRANLVLGTSLSVREMIALLALLDVRPVRRTGKTLAFRIPAYRVDLLEEIDLIEEIARVHGYDRIDSKTSAAIDVSHPLEKEDPAARVRSQLVGMGFREAVTNSMQDEARSVAPGITPVRVLNPLSKEMAVMRSSLVPGLLQVIALNQSRGTPDLRLFEIGHVFRVDPDAPTRLVGDYAEEERAAVILTGARHPRHWDSVSPTVDLYDLRGVVDGLLEALGLDNSRFIPYPTSDGLIETPLGVELHGGYAGLMGPVSPGMTFRYGVEGDVFAAEFLLSALRPGGRKPYVPLPRFPKVRRDVAFTFDRNIAAGNVENEIRRAGGELLVGVGVFDVYQGKGLPEGKKSLAFALELMSLERTLTDPEIDAVVGGIVRHIEQKFGAVLRGA